MPAPGWFRRALGGVEQTFAGESIVGAVSANSVPAGRGVTLQDLEADVPGGHMFRCGGVAKPGPPPEAAATVNVHAVMAAVAA